MKKLIIFFAIMFSFLGMLSAQEMSYEAKNYRSNIQKFLQEEGFSPYIDDDDALCFKKEGTLYWIYFNDSNPIFVEFYRENIKTDDADQAAVAKAVNETNLNKRAVKLSITEKKRITFTIEFYSNSTEHFKTIFYSNMKAFQTAKDFVVDKYSEYEGTNSLPFKISSVLVGNTTSSYNIITDYGKNIYSNTTQYLRPKLYIDVNTDGKYEFYVKFYTPNGISRGTNSPTDYSYKDELTLTKSNREYYLSGWGGSTSGHWKSGSYRFEIYYKDKLIFTKYFTVL